ncbi:choice-of-anchor D domain-containing protein, partial [bacterium]|nr:choice-of-anchor D domain-containing protein [bacterium]
STYFGQPGAGAGGDRLGIGEIAFADTEVPGEANIIIPDSVLPTLVDAVTTDFTISVFNSGGLELAISGTNLIGPNATAFSVLGAPAIIDPTSSADITLQFDPAGLGGPISATLQITSNDPDTPTAEVLINSSLPALGPDILVPAELALTAGGLAETLVIPVDNLGRAQLDIASINITGPNKANFVVTIPPANIAALSSDSVEITFDPAGLSPGAISATFQILSNDPDTPTAEILLSGGIAESFYPISSVTSATELGGSDFYLATNLIQGPGTGFDALWPHDALGFAQAFAWVTDAPNGGAGDYFAPVPAVRPNMVFDLGSDVGLGEISFWGYSDDNANGANLFGLRFATSADGPNGFGTSISYSPEFAPIQDQTQRQSFEFDQGVFARYVEWVPLDNFFGINPPGGDRVGAGEIAFAVRAVDNEITILSIARGADDVTLTFKSRDGLSYAIFRSPDLGETGWQELDDSFASQGDETAFVDFNVPEGIQRMFYQVRNAGE